MSQTDLLASKEKEEDHWIIPASKIKLGKEIGKGRYSTAHYTLDTFGDYSKFWSRFQSRISWNRSLLQGINKFRFKRRI